MIFFAMPGQSVLSHADNSSIEEFFRYRYTLYSYFFASCRGKFGKIRMCISFGARKLIFNLEFCISIGYDLLIDIVTC